MENLLYLVVLRLSRLVGFPKHNSKPFRGPSHLIGRSGPDIMGITSVLRKDFLGSYFGVCMFFGDNPYVSETPSVHTYISLNSAILYLGRKARTGGGTHVNYE